MKPFASFFIVFPDRRSLLVTGMLLLLSYPTHAADYYFDVNVGAAGSGVTNGSSYAAGGSTWNTVSAGTGTPGGTVGTAFRTNTLVFSAGTDATNFAYEMTGFNAYQMSGVRIEDGNVSLVNGSGFGSPTILTKTNTSLNITGNWDFYGNSNTFNAEASLLPGLWVSTPTIGPLIPWGFTSSPVWGGTWSLALDNTGKDLVLNYAAVPEPRAALLGCLGLLALLRRKCSGI